MERITSDRDYRVTCMILKWLQEQEQEVTDYEKAGILHQRIVSTKRAMRAYTHRNTNTFDVGMGFVCERRIVKDYGIDGYVELVSIPEVIDTLDGEDGADEFFKTFLEIHARPSMYDCTGQAFTSWYKLFKRRGQFWAYHSVCFDV